MIYHHQPVLLDYIVNNLLPNRNVIIDGTLGEGGHTLAFLEKDKKVICFERDKHILKKAQQRLKDYKNVEYINKNYSEIDCLTQKYSQKIDLILFDLGISMYHYRESKRGFTFNEEEELDMRLDDKGVSAYDIINNFSEQELADIFYHYGEEKKSRLYASRICHARKFEKIKTNQELCNVIMSKEMIAKETTVKDNKAEDNKEKIKNTKKSYQKIHPATKIFQAIRIRANDELSHIKKALEKSLPLLSSNGCLAVISYHSLEDRIVKNFFKEILPTKKKVNKYRLQDEENNQIKDNYFVEKKIIVADSEEVSKNRAARSAKMRILYKHV